MDDPPQQFFASIVSSDTLGKIVQLLPLILLFIALSGLLAMVDAAILSVSHAEVEAMVARKQRWSHLLRAVQNRITRAVVIIVIVTNTVNVLGPILVGQRAIALFGDDVIGIITAVLTFGTIIFSEIIPKALGTHYAPLISRAAAPIILTLTYLLYPLVWLLEKIVGVFKSGEREIGTEEQIRALVNLGGGAGHIEEDESQLIHKAFILNDRRARDIMHARDRIVAIPESATIREAAEVVFNHTYSRYPVQGESLDDIKGLVMSRDILSALAQGKDVDSVVTVLQEILSIPTSIRSDRLLTLFRDRGVHIAVVKDHEETVGVVTLEDVLEELVGEIEDEADTREARDRRLHARRVATRKKKVTRPAV